jgi:LUD domain
MEVGEKDLERVSRTVRALKRNEFIVFFFPKAEEARNFVIDSIPPGAHVGIGGSETVRTMGFIPILKERGMHVLDHWDTTLSLEQVLEIRKRHLTCDVFLSSVNAITEEGELINCDGIGNRICAMTFGPEKVFLLAGIQKIVEDLQAGFRRIHEIAAPRRAKSLNLDLPCTKGYGCVDCSDLNRICRATTILHRRPSLSDITVVLIGEELGY